MFTLSIRNSIFQSSLYLGFDSREKALAAFTAIAQSDDGILVLCLEGDGKVLAVYNRNDDPRFNPDARNVWAHTEGK